MDATRYLVGGIARAGSLPDGAGRRSAHSSGSRPRGCLPHGPRPGALRPKAFGALQWLLVLAERLPAADALTAVDGWGSDAFVAYEHDGAGLREGRFEGQRPSDTDEMDAALTRWAAGMPAGVARSAGPATRWSWPPATRGRTSAGVSRQPRGRRHDPAHQPGRRLGVGPGERRQPRPGVVLRPRRGGHLLAAELAAADTTPGFGDKLGLLERRCTSHPA